MVSRDPDAVTICCSLVPANWPSIAWVIAVGGWIVREYMNIDEVVAMMLSLQPKAVRLHRGNKLWEWMGTDGDSKDAL